MFHVEMSLVKGHLWMRAGNAELLITPMHVAALHKCQETKVFATYFLEKALLNRPARKLFQSWLRKDARLWRKTYNLVMSIPQEPIPQAPIPQEQAVSAGTDVIDVEGEIVETESNKQEQQDNQKEKTK